MDGTRPLPELMDHVVVCNCNEKVPGMVREIHAGSKRRPIDVVLVCSDMAIWRANPRWFPHQADRDHFFVIEGNPTSPEDLAQVGIGRARAAVILADPRQGDLADARSTLVAVAIERQNPQVHTIIELIASTNRIHLKTTDVNEVVCLGELAEKLMAQSCITPGIKNVFHHLLSSNDQTNQIFTLPIAPCLRGESFRSISKRMIKNRVPFTLCGIGVPCHDPAVAHIHARNSGQPMVFVLNPSTGSDPGKDTRLVLGDELIVIASERPDLEAAFQAAGEL